MLKKTAAVLILALFGVLLSGCKQDIMPAGNEIEQFAIMQVCGIDKSSENPEDVEVTFLTENAKKNAGFGMSGGEEQIYSIASATGKTVFEAERKLKAHSDKKVFFGYVDYFLIGEDAAKDNFNKYFDFLMREHEIRYTPKVYIIKGASAKELMNKTTSDHLHLPDRLDNVNVDISLFSNFDELNIVDVAAMLNKENTGAVIPALALREVKDEQLLGGRLPEMDVGTSGYAVLKDFNLAGFFDEPYARGYNMLTGKMKSSVVNVQDSSRQQVALEITKSKTRTKVSFNGDTPESVTYHVHVYSNINEQQSREDIYTTREFKNLCAQQSEILKGEMEQVIAKSKEFGIDCVELGQRIQMRYPNKWERIKDNWRDIFTNLDITVEVDSDIQRTYDLHEPNGLKLRND